MNLINCGCGGKHDDRCNLIYDGGFSGQGGYWGYSGQAGFDAIVGKSILGAGKMVSNGDEISQQFSIIESLTYTFAFYVLGMIGGSIRVFIKNEGLQLLQNDVVTSGVWQAEEIEIGLPAGSYTLIFENLQNADMWLDDVHVSHIPATREYLAECAEAQLGDIAGKLGISKEATELLPEGDYTKAIDQALKGQGAIDCDGCPSVSCLKPCEVNEVVERVVEEMFSLLHNRAMLQPVKRTVGPVSEDLGMISAIEKRMNRLPGQQRGGAVVTTRLIRKDDYY